MKKTASDFYRNRMGNCAQAVAAAWCEKTGKSCGLVQEMSKFGTGRAPEGYCGALYAAEYIVDSENAEELVDAFRELSGGHVACRAIRQAKSLNCIECVEAAAELLEKHIPE